MTEERSRPGRSVTASVVSLAASRPLTRRCWRVFDLHDFRADGLLDMGLAQTKQAHAIGRISMGAGLKEATHLVDAQRVVEELHAFCRVDIHRLVLARGQFAAIVANSGDTTQQ